jgi:low temperature requirement protein LtrA
LRMVRLVVFWRVWLEFTNFLVFLDSKRKVYRSFWLRSLMILLLLLG